MAVTTTTTTTATTACIVFIDNLPVGYFVDLTETLAHSYQVSEQKLSGWFRVKSGHKPNRLGSLHEHQRMRASVLDESTDNFFFLFGRHLVWLGCNNELKAASWI